MRSELACLSIVVMFLLSSGPVIGAGQEPVSVGDLSRVGWSAVEAQKYGEALEAFTAALEQAPEEPTLWFGSGAAAYMLGRDDEAKTSLERALDLDPRLVDAARFLGELYHRTGHLEQAITVYRNAATYAPDDTQLTDTLQDWERESQIQGRFYESRGAHFRVQFEGPTDDALARRIVQILESAYRDVGGALRTYPSAPINVILYTQEQFQDVTRSPAWAAAAYDGQIRVPVRGALSTDRRDELKRVLTHEYVHAVVAQLGGRTVPVWVNEGLATVFEPGGLSQASAVMASASSRPSLRALQDNFAGLSGAGVSIAYAQSALTVDKMIGLGGAPAVVLLLEDLARGVSFESALHRRIGVRYDELERMARNLR